MSGLYGIVRWLLITRYSLSAMKHPYEIRNLSLIAVLVFALAMGGCGKSAEEEVKEQFPYLAERLGDNLRIPENSVTLYRTNGPYGGNIRALVIGQDGSVYAGTLVDGVFRSQDAGGSWEAVNQGLTNLDVWSMAIGEDGSVYAGTEGGVFRNRDMGGN